MTVRSGTIQPGVALRSNTTQPGITLRSTGSKVHHKGERRFVHRRIHLGVFPYNTYGCYEWRRVRTTDGWRLRRVNVCDPYYSQYYY
jgi:hypothetical protein